MAGDPSKSDKLEPTAHPQSDSDSLEVVVKVRTARYHPSCVKLRAQISPHIFTATVLRDDLKALQDDAEVASVSVSRQLFSPE